MLSNIIADGFQVVDQTSPAKVAAYIQSGAAPSKGIDYQMIRI